MITFELLSPGKYLPANYFKDLAAGTDRTEIEIGPGDGRFLFESAALAPTTVFVGLELRKGWAEKLIGDETRPANALVYNADGRWLCVHLIADNSVDAFHLYFPDPWWKKRHHKRRLVTAEFASGIRRCLKPGASAYVITDVPPLFAAIEKELVAAGLCCEEWTRDRESPAQSSYERKYRRQGRHLYSARFCKPTG
jgi:tRNA (guanine-N7-)-methyltransferase